MEDIANVPGRRAMRPSKQGLLALVILISLATTGFVRSPHAHWARGRITAIDNARSLLSLETIPAHKMMAIQWDSKTLFWQEPEKRNERGAEFQATNVVIGQEVRVMFRKVSKSNFAARILGGARESRSADKSK